MIEHSIVAVRGANLHVARAGLGPPLLLLHGWPEFWLTWEPVMTRLANRFDLIAPDLRGFGGSDKPAGPFGPADQAEDLVGLLDALGIGSVGIVSHDVGATITQTLARRHPNRIVGLFFFNFMYPGIRQTRYRARPSPARMAHLVQPERPCARFAGGFTGGRAPLLHILPTELGAPEGSVRRRRDRCVRGQLPGARQPRRRVCPLPRCCRPAPRGGIRRSAAAAANPASDLRALGAVRPDAAG